MLIVCTRTIMAKESQKLNPKLSQHPYKLVSMIALIDATYFLLFNTLDEVCNFKLQTIYAYTAYFDGSAQS